VTELSPIAALFIYQSGAVVISVVYVYVFYKVIIVLINRFAPIVESWLDLMSEISKTQGEILEAFRRFNGKEKSKR
jgi:hypothetical protein